MHCTIKVSNLGFTLLPQVMNFVVSVAKHKLTIAAYQEL